MKIRTRSANNIVLRAFQKINVVAPGETIQAQELEQGALALFEMVDAWNGSGLAIPAIRERTAALTAGVSEYEYGNGWGGVKPIEYLGAAVTDASGERYEITIRGYGSRLSNISGGNVWIEKGGTFDRHHLSFQPVDSETITYLVREPFTASRDDVAAYQSNADDTAGSFDWPSWEIGGNGALYVEEGFISALIYNLALELLTEYPVNLPSTQIQLISNKAVSYYENLTNNALEIPERWPPGRVPSGAYFNWQDS